MQGLGGFLVLMGAGSFVLHFMNMEFTLLGWVDNWGSGCRDRHPHRDDRGRRHHLVPRQAAGGQEGIVAGLIRSRRPEGNFRPVRFP